MPSISEAFLCDLSNSCFSSLVTLSIDSISNTISVFALLDFFFFLIIGLHIDFSMCVISYKVLSLLNLRNMRFFLSTDNGFYLRGIITCYLLSF